MAFTPIVFTGSDSPAYLAAFPSTYAAAYFSNTTAYPTTRGGITAGSTGMSGRNVALGTGPYKYYQLNSSSTSNYIQIDMPNGAGVYRLKGAFGAGGVSNDQSVEIYDAVTGVTIYTMPVTARAAGTVASLDGVQYPEADWPGADTEKYVELTLPASIRLRRNSAATFYIAALMIEHQSTPLDPLKIRKNGVAGPLSNSGVRALQDTAYSGEPLGEIFGKIEVASGAENITIVGGGMASYLAIETIGSYQYLVYRNSRMPSTVTPTLTLRQTTTGETKDTAFTFTLVSDGGRPLDGTILGQITTPTWLHRVKVKAMRDAAWFGYAGQSFVTDVAVTNRTDLTAAIAAITPTGSSWHRIRLQVGDYNGGITLADRNYGTGGLLIEPDTGHDPDFSVTFATCQSGLHIRNIRNSLNGGSTVAWRFNEPSGTFYNRIVLENMRVGRMFRTGAVITDVADTASYTSTAMLFSHGESLVYRNNVMDGCGVTLSANGIRTFVDEYNETRRCLGDILKIAQAVNYTSPSGIFATNECFHWRKGHLAHQQIDYDGFNTAAHQDNCQVATFGQNMSKWYISTGRDGKQGVSSSGYQKNWQVGELVYSTGNDRIYQVATAPTTSTNGHSGGITGSTMPTAMQTDSDTSTGIVDGELTWNFVSANPFATVPLWAYWEDCVSHTAAYSTTGNPSSGQYFINSNGGFNMPFNIALVNCMAATGNSRGTDNGGISFDVYSTDISGAGISGAVQTFGKLPNITRSEFCSWIAPARIASVDSINLGTNSPTGGTYVTSRKCVVGTLGTVADVSTLDDVGTVIVDWRSGSTATPTSLLRGSASMLTYNGGQYGYYEALVDLDMDKDVLRSSLSKIVHHNTGAAGARLKETHTITVTDSLGASVTLTLDVAP